MLGKLSTTNLRTQTLDMFLIYLLYSFYSRPLHTDLSLSRAGFISSLYAVLRRAPGTWLTVKSAFE